MRFQDRVLSAVSNRWDRTYNVENRVIHTYSPGLGRVFAEFVVPGRVHRTLDKLVAAGLIETDIRRYPIVLESGKLGFFHRRIVKRVDVPPPPSETVCDCL